MGYLSWKFFPKSVAVFYLGGNFYLSYLSVSLWDTVLKILSNMSMKRKMSSDDKKGTRDRMSTKFTRQIGNKLFKRLTEGI